MSIRSAARTSSCSTAPPSCSTTMRALPCSCRPGRRRSASPSGGARTGAGAVCPGLIAEIEEGDAANYLACVTGLRDYVEKNGFPGVVLGLSGGIDSALCAAMAVDALGPRRVHGVMLPYTYTSNESLSDAAGDRRGASHPLRHHADPCGGRRLEQKPGERVRRDDARRDRGKSPVACPRHAADGASPTNSVRSC